MWDIVKAFLGFLLEGLKSAITPAMLTAIIASVIKRVASWLTEFIASLITDSDDDVDAGPTRPHSTTPASQMTVDVPLNPTGASGHDRTPDAAGPDQGATGEWSAEGPVEYGLPDDAEDGLISAQDAQALTERVVAGGHSEAKTAAIAGASMII